MEIIPIIGIALAASLLSGLWFSLFLGDSSELLRKKDSLLSDSKKVLFKKYIDLEKRFEKKEISPLEWEKIRKKFLDDYKKILL